MKNLKEKAFDEWLVINSQNGDKQALHTLIERWQHKLLAYAMSQLQEPEAAREVTQDSLYSIAKGINNLKDPAAYPKWAYQILTRRINDWLKKEIRWRKTHQTDSHEKLDHCTSEFFAEQQNVLRDCLQQVGTELSKLLRLFYLDGLSIKEIAELLDMPAGTVKSRLFYARKKFQQTLEKNQ